MTAIATAILLSDLPRALSSEPHHQVDFPMFPVMSWCLHEKKHLLLPDKIEQPHLVTFSLSHHQTNPSTGRSPPRQKHLILQQLSKHLTSDSVPGWRDTNTHKVVLIHLMILRILIMCIYIYMYYMYIYIYIHTFHANNHAYIKSEVSHIYNSTSNNPAEFCRVSSLPGDHLPMMPDAGQI